MNLTDYKPGRRLDAMVAMCLGWRWAFPKGRPDDSIELASVDSPLVEDYWDVYISEYNWSTNDGAAFEAARDAGVLDEFSVTIGLGWMHTKGYGVLTDGSRYEDIEAPTLAHALCLGILAIQPAEKLAEYESWLPEEVE